MNKFIEIRKKFFEDKSENNFSSFFIAEYVKRNTFKDIEDFYLISKTSNIQRFNINYEINRDKIIDLLSDLGENEYIDRYIVDIIIRNIKLFNKYKIQNIIKSIISDSKNTSKIYNLLDIAIEGNISVLDEKAIKDILKNFNEDLDVFVN